MSQKIVLLGANGQLGQTLQQHFKTMDCELLALGRDTLDISDETALRKTLGELAPDVIINAAAYTAVDQAETDDLDARAANAAGPKHLARWVKEQNSWLLHLSTDFVFSGRNHRPYTPDDQTDPLSIYGRTKLEGELHVRYLARDNSLVLRTSWVYSQYGRNFLTTMLRLMAEKDSLNVVDDQIGTPSSTLGLARCIAAAVDKRPVGILHWTDAGVASWYDFAVAIQDEAIKQGLLAKAIPIHPIPTTAYPTPARRPSFSVLDKTATMAVLDCQPQHWRRELVHVIKQIQK
ncbi:dTDP-4-dehydrorhamnose reductase [Pseudohongiella sp.]|uniref:RmlD-like substrate binding domain-containing protein n=1 Tax=marine sediment metagenome TaxID=412755 RepID=A0A0F9YA08_9ZZZZ|nr:dTDP-4-dehydrorhamnose reductase [Pseudohongiella sp.]HDZ08724.1 dTDP-4-dehydrorhamnose reductase [Pseudohongiella sp.]HEA62340.1 dTDP-4-dehydrorhamnose reductase [Pseudohongiella sp.]